MPAWTKEQRNLIGRSERKHSYKCLVKNVQSGCKILFTFSFLPAHHHRVLCAHPAFTQRPQSLHRSHSRSHHQTESVPCCRNHHHHHRRHHPQPRSRSPACHPTLRSLSQWPHTQFTITGQRVYGGSSATSAKPLASSNVAARQHAFFGFVALVPSKLVTSRLLITP